jgi:alanyl-tRNA synthetase
MDLTCGTFFFLQIYPDPVRVVSVGHKVEDLLANPESEEWLSISTELCGGLFAILHYAL